MNLKFHVSAFPLDLRINYPILLLTWASNLNTSPSLPMKCAENFQTITQVIQAAAVQQQQEREEDRQDINALKLLNIAPDKCEVVMYGLPQKSNLTYSQAASQLISALSLLSTYTSESTFREWTAAIPNFPPSAKNSQPVTYKALVMRLPNSEARDRLVFPFTSVHYGLLLFTNFLISTASCVQLSQTA